MRKLTILVLTLVMLAMPIIPVAAQAPAAYESTVSITNLSSGEGSISLNFYNKNDGTIAATTTDTIGAYETKFYASFAAVGSGFDGSMVISSSVPLASSSTIIGKDSADNKINYASYVGVSTGSDTVYLPLLMDSNYGFSTYYYVQNVSGSDVTVTIDYDDGLSVANIVDLPAGASVKIDNKSEAHVAKKFSATLTTSGGDIAVAVVEYGEMTTYGRPLYAYNGFKYGSTNPVIPMVNQNNYGYWTAIPIQNLGGVATTVTLTYIPTKAGNTCTETLTIPAYGQAEFGSFAHAYAPQTPGTTCVLGERFVGVATVTQNSASQPLVGLMNQLNSVDDNDKGAALMTINPSDGTAMVAFPEVYQWYGSYGWWTALTITNISGSTLPAGDITCHAIGSANGGAVDETWSNPTSLANGQGWITDLYNGWGPLPNNFLGGVVCTSATGTIVGNNNTLGALAPANLDTLIINEGISVTP